MTKNKKGKQMSKQKDKIINVVQVTCYDGTKYSFRTDKPNGEKRYIDLIASKRKFYQSLPIKQRRALEIKYLDGKATICISKQVQMKESEYYKNPAVKEMGVEDEQTEKETGPVFTNIKSTTGKEYENITGIEKDIKPNVTGSDDTECNNIP